MLFISHMFRWLSVFITYSYVTSHPRFGGLNYKYLLSHSSCRSGIQEQLTSVVWLKAPHEVAAKMSARAEGQTLGLTAAEGLLPEWFIHMPSKSVLVVGRRPCFLPSPISPKDCGRARWLLVSPPRARQKPFQRGAKVTLGTQRCFGRFSQILVLYFLFWGGLVFFYSPLTLY